MCRISKISHDWIVKGFHLHVFDVELVMRPDHQGGIKFKKVFQSTPDLEIVAAVNRAMELMMDRTWRALLYREALRAREYMVGDSSSLAGLARGRAAEFTFLASALKRMGIE
jgi:hypothetical protein